MRRYQSFTQNACTWLADQFLESDNQMLITENKYNKFTKKST